MIKYFCKIKDIETLLNHSSDCEFLYEIIKRFPSKIGSKDEVKVFIRVGIFSKASERGNNNHTEGRTFAELVATELPKARAIVEIRFGSKVVSDKVTISDEMLLLLVEDYVALNLFVIDNFDIVPEEKRNFHFEETTSLYNELARSKEEAKRFFDGSTTTAIKPKKLNFDLDSILDKIRTGGGTTDVLTDDERAFLVEKTRENGSK